MNWKARFKNPFFWIGIGALFISTVGLTPSELITWKLLGQAVKDVVLNPFLSISFVIALVGIIFDPSTGGLLDKFKRPSK